jgi:hypothetical protein
VPRIVGNSDICAFELTAASILHGVHAEVVFEWVVASDVIVALIFRPPDDASSLIDASITGSKMDGHLYVSVTGVSSQDDIEDR